MALFRQFGEFVGEEEEWPQYVERLEHYLCTNTIDGEDRRHAVFPSTISPKVYNINCCAVCSLL